CLRGNIFASISVQGSSAHYHVSANERYVWAIVFCRDAGSREHCKRHTDRAFFSYTRLQYGPADKPTRLLASQRRPERNGSFKREHYSPGLLHVVHTEFKRCSFSSKNHANQRYCNTYSYPYCYPYSYGSPCRAHESNRRCRKARSRYAQMEG